MILSFIFHLAWWLVEDHFRTDHSNTARRTHAVLLTNKTARTRVTPIATYCYLLLLPSYCCNLSQEKRETYVLQQKSTKKYINYPSCFPSNPTLYLLWVHLHVHPGMQLTSHPPPYTQEDRFSSEPHSGLLFTHWQLLLFLFSRFFPFFFAPSSNGGSSSNAVPPKLPPPIPARGGGAYVPKHTESFHRPT